MIGNKIKLSLILLITISAALFAQTYNISGTIKDNSDLPLAGVNVFLEETYFGTSTNINGEFLLTNITTGEYNLIASLVGYKKGIKSGLEVNRNVSNIIINLEETIYQSEQIIISANKYGKKLEDLPVSASIISADVISKKNYTSLDKAMRFVPGVSVTLDQISIRGSSGYSRGAGTRVLVLYDGTPIYTGDSGEIVWELIPIYEVEKIEVIKGASSSLYGSTAIGGVVNVISKGITSRPVTFIKSSFGLYDDPYHSEWKWSGDSRMFNTLSVSHSQSFGKFGASFSIYRTEDYGYRKNDYDKKLGAYFKLSYLLSKYTSFSLWGTGYSRDRETFNFWKDIRIVLEPPDSDLGNSQPSDREIFGASIKHKFDDDLEITVKPSFHRTFWKDQSESANHSRAVLYRSEIRVRYNLSDEKIVISGIEGQYGNVVSNIFGNRSGSGFGVFSELEYPFTPDLTFFVGGRFDYSKLQELDGESAISPKAALNYKMSESIILRASVGAGFRSPTLAEAFTSTSASGIQVKPNPDISSESSYNMEVGASYHFSESVSLDLSLFNAEYYDFIEPVLDPADNKIFFNNITRARISGAEVTALISPIRNLNLNIAYLFLNPRDLSLKEDLMYRSRQSYSISADYTYGIAEAGIDYRFASRVNEINDELVDFNLVPDGDKRVDIHVADVFVSLKLFQYGIPAKIIFKGDNIFNYNYIEMIGNVSPIRNYSLSAEILF